MRADQTAELVKRYHSTHYRSFMPRDRKEWDFVVARLEVNFGRFLESMPRESAIADLACGVGYLEHLLLRMGFRNIDAVDLSGEQVEAARDALRARAVEHEGRVNFLVEDVFRYLPGRRGLAGLAMIDLIEHFPRGECLDLLGLAREALAPGGFLLLRTPNAEHPMFGRFYNDFTHQTPFTLRSLEQCLRLTGFQVVEAGLERPPPAPAGRGRLLGGARRAIRRLGLRLLSRLLRTPESISDDLVCIARK